MALLITAAVTAHAQDRDRGWRVRVGPSWADPEAELARVEDDQQILFDVDDGLGGSLGVEYRFFRLFGVELGVWNATSLDARLQVAPAGELPGDTEAGVSTAITELDLFAVELAGNFRLFSAGHADFYVGPVIAWLTYDDPTFRFSGAGGPIEEGGVVIFSVDDEIAIGYQAGVDWAFGGGSWIANLELEYLEVDLEAEGEEALAFDPYVVSVRLGYRF